MNRQYPFTPPSSNDKRTRRQSGAYNDKEMDRRIKLVVEAARRKKNDGRSNVTVRRVDPETLRGGGR